MKILVPIKRVLDPYARVRVTPDGRLDSSDGKYVINPFDEIALEEAVRIRESGEAGDIEIVAVTIGAPECEEQLRNALAAGADSAVLIESDGSPGPSRAAALLAAFAMQQKPDLVLMGKQAIDDDCNQTGQRLAARLGWPQATFASKIEVAEGGLRARVTREVDRGREIIEVDLPAVVTADLRLNEPRYIALPAIVRARNKPLRQLPASALGDVPEADGIEVLALEPPKEREAGRILGSVDELIGALRSCGALPTAREVGHA